MRVGSIRRLERREPERAERKLEGALVEDGAGRRKLRSHTVPGARHGKMIRPANFLLRMFLPQQCQRADALENIVLPAIPRRGIVHGRERVSRERD